MATRAYLMLDRLVALVGLLALGCQPPVSTRLDDELLTTADRDIVLGFDLRTDQDPTAVLVVSQKGANSQPVEAGASSGPLVVWLPIEGRNAEVSGSLVGAVGMYSTYTIATVLASAERTGDFVLHFSPMFTQFTGDIINPDDLSGDLYLIREGLRRTFLYRTGGLEEQVRWAGDNLTSLPVQAVEAVALAFPEGSEGREVARGRTSVPEMLYEANGLRFYPAGTSNGSANFLQVGYVVRPSAESRTLAKVASKVLGALVLPVVTLILLSREEAKRPRARRAALSLLVTAQLCLLGFLFWLSWSSGLEGVEEAFLDLIPVLTGAAAQGAVIWTKRREVSTQDQFSASRARRARGPFN